MCNNPNLNLVNINAYARFSQNPLIYTQDIERKHGMMASRTTSKQYTPIPILRMWGVGGGITDDVTVV